MNGDVEKKKKRRRTRRRKEGRINTSWGGQAGKDTRTIARNLHRKAKRVETTGKQRENPSDLCSFLLQGKKRRHLKLIESWKRERWDWREAHDGREKILHCMHVHPEESFLNCEKERKKSDLGRKSKNVSLKLRKEDAVSREKKSDVLCALDSSSYSLLSGRLLRRSIERNSSIMSIASQMLQDTQEGEGTKNRYSLYTPRGGGGVGRGCSV